MSREERLRQRADKRSVATEGGVCRAFRCAQKPFLVGFHCAEEMFRNGLAGDGGACQAETGSHSEAENHVACDGACVGEIVRRACCGASEEKTLGKRSRHHNSKRGTQRYEGVVMVRALGDPHKAEGLVAGFDRNALYRFPLRHRKRDNRMSSLMPGKALTIPLCWRVHGEQGRGNREGGTGNGEPETRNPKPET